MGRIYSWKMWRSLARVRVVVSCTATATPKDEVMTPPSVSLLFPADVSLKPLSFFGRRETSNITPSGLGDYNNLSPSPRVLDAAKRGREQHLFGNTFGCGGYSIGSIGREGASRVPRSGIPCDAAAASFHNISTGFPRMSSGSGKRTSSGGAYNSVGMAVCCAAAAGYMSGVSCAGSPEPTSPTEVMSLFWCWFAFRT